MEKDTFLSVNIQMIKITKPQKSKMSFRCESTAYPVKSTSVIWERFDEARP